MERPRLLAQGEIEPEIRGEDRTGTEQSDAHMLNRRE